MGAAKSKVVGAMMRKHLVEAGIPVLAELKRMLEAQRHRLLGPLMNTLQVLLKDHKHEVHPTAVVIAVVMHRLRPAMLGEGSGRDVATVEVAGMLFCQPECPAELN